MPGRPWKKIRRLNRTNCRTCNIEFTKFNSVQLGLYRAPDCKTCYNEIQRVRSVKYDVLKRRYNLTTEEFNKLRELQQDKCAICGRIRKLCVDHNHKTKEVRGLLCRKCNSALGYLEDSEKLTLNLLGYIRKYKEIEDGTN